MNIEPTLTVQNAASLILRSKHPGAFLHSNPYKLKTAQITQMVQVQTAHDRRKKGNGTFC